MIKFLYARRTYDDIDDEHARRVNHSTYASSSPRRARARGDANRPHRTSSFVASRASPRAWYKSQSSPSSPRSVVRPSSPIVVVVVVRRALTPVGFLSTRKRLDTKKRTPEHEKTGTVSYKPSVHSSQKLAFDEFLFCLGNTNAVCYVIYIVNYTRNFCHHTPRVPKLNIFPILSVIIRSYLEQSTRTHRHTKVKPQWAELVLSGEPLENPWCRMVFLFRFWCARAPVVGVALGIVRSSSRNCNVFLCVVQFLVFWFWLTRASFEMHRPPVCHASWHTRWRALYSIPSMERNIQGISTSII